MLLLILGGLTVVAMGVAVLSRRARKDRRADNLGTVSQGWIANHRASSHKTNR